MSVKICYPGVLRSRIRTISRINPILSRNRASSPSPRYEELETGKVIADKVLNGLFIELVLIVSPLPNMPPNIAPFKVSHQSQDVSNSGSGAMQPQESTN